MTRYMPITGIDCTIPSLLIDTEAPVDVLHDTAAYRIRCGRAVSGRRAGW
jgi:hypothetical protein